MVNAIIDWGDGSAAESVAVGNSPWTLTDWAHTYTAPGRYVVSVMGEGGSADTQDIWLSAEPKVVVTVPAAMTPQQGVAYTYDTSLTNDAPVGVAAAVQTVRLHRTDGLALMPNQVTYETFDSGQWKTKTLVRDGNDLVLVETYPIPAHLDADSQVRVTFTTAVGTVVQGRSTVRDGSAVLAQADYTFTVQAAAAVTITGVSPTAITLTAAEDTVTVTGTGLDTVERFQGWKGGTHSGLFKKSGDATSVVLAVDALTEAGAWYIAAEKPWGTEVARSTQALTISVT